MGKFDFTAYNREKYRSFMVRVDRGKHPEIIERLEHVENVSGYVRELVEKDIKENGEEKKRV